MSEFCVPFQRPQLTDPVKARAAIGDHVPWVNKPQPVDLVLRANTPPPGYSVVKSGGFKPCDLVFGANGWKPTDRVGGNVKVHIAARPNAHYVSLHQLCEDFHL